MHKNPVLILGGMGSVGFACAKQFAKLGHNLILICRGRRIKDAEYELKVKALREYGVTVDIVKGNICNEECLQKVLNLIKGRSLFAMVHASADGNVGSIFDGEKKLNENSFVYTLNTMCISFVTWTQALIDNANICEGSSIIGFSSEGFYRVLPQYAANGVAKAGLETLCLYMAEELKSKGISVFVFRTKMMDTNAIKIFDSYEMLKKAQISENANKSLTTPDEIASKVISFITRRNAVDMKYGVIDLCHNDY